MKLFCDYCVDTFWWDGDGFPLLEDSPLSCDVCHRAGKGRSDPGGLGVVRDSIESYGHTFSTHALPYAPPPYSVDSNMFRDNETGAYDGVHAYEPPGNHIHIPVDEGLWRDVFRRVAVDHDKAAHSLIPDHVNEIRQLAQQNVNQIRSYSVGYVVSKFVHRLSEQMQTLYLYREKLEKTFCWVVLCQEVADILLSVNSLVTAKLYSTYALSCFNQIKRNVVLRGDKYRDFEQYLVCTDRIITLHIMFKVNSLEVRGAMSGFVFCGPRFEDLNAILVVKAVNGQKYNQFEFMPSSNVMMNGVMSAYHKQPPVCGPTYEIVDCLYTLFIAAHLKLYYTYDNIDFSLLLKAYMVFANKYRRETVAAFKYGIPETTQEVNWTSDQQQTVIKARLDSFLTRWAGLDSDYKNMFVRETVLICQDLCENWPDAPNELAIEILDCRNSGIACEMQDGGIQMLIRDRDLRSPHLKKEYKQRRREVLNELLQGNYQCLMRAFRDGKDRYVCLSGAARPILPLARKCGRPESATLSERIRQLENDQMRCRHTVQSNVNDHEEAVNTANMNMVKLVAEEDAAKLRKQQQVSRKKKRKNVITPSADHSVQKDNLLKEEEEAGAVDRPVREEKTTKITGDILEGRNSGGGAGGGVDGGQCMMGTKHIKGAKGVGMAAATKREARDSQIEGFVLKESVAPSAEHSMSSKIERLIQKDKGDHQKMRELQAELNVIQNDLKKKKTAINNVQESDMPQFKHECVLCFENMPNMLCEPCMHVFICLECSQKDKISMCMICQLPVTTVSRVFIS